MGKELYTPAIWTKVKKDYISGTLSMRGISRKYGMAVSVISERCKKENWNDIKEKIKNSAEQKMIEKVSDAQASNAELAEEILSKLMQKINLAVDAINPMDTSATKQLTQCMKDLADMGVYKVESKEGNIEIGFDEVNDYAD